MVIKKIIDEYLSKFEDERDALTDLIELTESCETEEQLVSRKNFSGHITSSSILVSRKSKKMLKIYHENLKQYFQPGGHILKEQTPLENAISKLKRLGITHWTFVPESENELIPLDIDSHTIPRNVKKSEPEHFHHDLRYLFVCEEEFSLKEQDFVWEEIPELKKYGTYKNLIDKIQFLWSNEYSEKQFYNDIVKEISIPKEVSFIVVQHFLPGVEHFLRSLESLGRVEFVIPKPKSLTKEIKNRLEKSYPIHLVSRDDLIENEELRNVLSRNDKIVIIDIGGWFAGYLTELSDLYPNRIIGVVEDTENGFQKYEKISEKPCPIISVARSPLKLNEDTLIGQSIVFSADSILRRQNGLIKYMNCGVLGYGKVGKSIALDLMGKSIKPVVFETNPLRQIEAYNDGCSISNRIELLESSDVLFCATGNKSIRTEDLSFLKRESYIFSVTSADDEFEFTDLEKTYNVEQIDQYVTRHYKFENSFYLVNKGNAVNFIHKAVVGDFIHLVKAEMLMALNTLINEEVPMDIQEVSSETRRTIAEIWLKQFHGLEYD